MRRLAVEVGIAVALGVAPLGQGQQLLGFKQTVEGRALVEERRLWPVEIFGLCFGVERPAAERNHPAANIGDREHDAVAKAVIGRRAVLWRDQKPRIGKVRHARALGHQIILQDRAPARRIAQTKPGPVRLRQAAPFQIGAGLGPDRSAKLGLEPLGRQFQPVAQTLTPLFRRLVLGVGRGQGHARLGR